MVMSVSYSAHNGDGEQPKARQRLPVDDNAARDAVAASCGRTLSTKKEMSSTMSTT
jgi:hypothetical protein